MPKPASPLNCCTREALDSQDDFGDEPRGQPGDGPRARDGIGEAVSDIVASLFGCARADELQERARRGDSPRGASGRPVPEMLPDGFEAWEGHDIAARGAGGDRMLAIDLEHCKQCCREKGFGAFIVRAGMAYFRHESAEKCRACLVSSRGATAYLDIAGSAAARAAKAEQDAASAPLQSFSSQASARGSLATDSSHQQRCKDETTESTTDGLSVGGFGILSGIFGKLRAPAALCSRAEEVPEVMDEHQSVQAAAFGGSSPLSTRLPASWSPSGDPIDEELPAPMPPLALARAGASQEPGSSSRGPRTPNSSRGGSPTNSAALGSALDRLGALLGEGAEDGASGSRNLRRARTASPPPGHRSEPHSPSSVNSAPADARALASGSGYNHLATAQARPPPQPYLEEPPPEPPRHGQASAQRGIEETPPPAPPADLGAAQAEQCRRRLAELTECLQTVDRDLRAAKPDDWGSIMGSALRKAQGLDREAASALEKLPVAAASAAALAQQQHSLHENVLKLEATARPYLKEQATTSYSPQADQPLTAAALSGEAHALHARLEDLSSALQAWTNAWDRARRETTSSSAADPHFGGQVAPQGLQHEELMVERASVALEEFRISLVAGESGPRRGAELLRALAGFSQWADRERVQALLRSRQAFLTDGSLDPGAVRLSCGRVFLQHAAQKEKWPTAEPLAARWRDALVRTLGPRGSADWKERAARLPAQLRARAADRKQLPDHGTLCIRRIRAHRLCTSNVVMETNPYVVFELAGVGRQTGVAWNNGASPEWREKDNPAAWEEIRFDVDQLRQHPLLRVSVWDHDRFSEPDALGRLDDIDLADLLMPPPPLPDPSAAPRPPEDGMGRALQLLGLGKSPEQFAREQQDQEVERQLRQAAHARAMREREARTTVEVHDDGSVTCQLRPVRLVGEGAWREASIEFELFYQTGAAGDPLVLQPEAEDDALALVGQVEDQLRAYEDTFRACNEGFFLAPVDCKQLDLSLDSPLKRTFGVSPPFPQVSQQISDEVFKYNRLLDRLNIMTTDHRHGGQEASALLGGRPLLSEGGAGDVQQQEWTDQFTVAAEEFTSLLDELRMVERTVGGDMETRRYFAFQDELLPTVGEWSLDRRRRLRNQAFLASLEVDRKRQRQRASAPQPLLGTFCGEEEEMQPIAAAVCGALSIYGVAMGTLVFGGGWQQQGWVMLIASVLAVTCLLIAGYLFGARLLSGVTAQMGASYAPLLEHSAQPRQEHPGEARALAHNHHMKAMLGHTVP